MSTSTRNAAVIIVSLGIMVFLILAGSAIIVYNGPVQTCARSHGHWIEHYDSTSPTYNGWVNNKECRR